MTQRLGRQRARLGHGQHRFRRNGSRHAPHEPDAVSAVLSREAHVLSRGRRHLRVRARAQPGRAAVLQPPDRPGRRQEVPILAGGKVNGRVGSTNFGGLVVGTNDKAGVVDDEAVMAVGAREAEPLAGVVGRRHRDGRRSARAATAAGWPAPTSPMRRRTFAATRISSSASWGLATGRDGLGGDRTALRLQDRLSQRSLGHRADLQAHRPRLRSVARLRAAAGGAICTTGRSTTAQRLSRGPIPAAAARVRADRSRPISQDAGRATASSSRR